MNRKGLPTAIWTLVLAWGLLLGLWAILRPTAEANCRAYDDMIMGWLLPGSGTFTPEPYSGEDPAITAVQSGETGYVVETAVEGYADTVVLWVGVDRRGYVTGIAVRDLAETWGLGRRTASDRDFLLQFLRNSGDAAVGENIDAVTGATVSSRAVAKAVNAAVGFVTGAEVSSRPTEWGD